MISRGIIRLFSQKKSILSLVRVSQPTIIYRPVFNFSSEDKPPSGFEKFQRKSKPQANKPEKQENLEKQKQEINQNQDQQTKNEELKKEDNPKSTETQESENSTKEDSELKSDDKNQKPKKKPNKITYNAKFFGFGDTNKNTKNENKTESEENEGEKQNKKEEESSSFKFGSFNDGNLKITPLGWAVLGFSTLAIGKVAYDYLYDIPTIDYIEFSQNYLDQDKIQKIVISRVTDGSHFKVYAIIQTKNKEQVKLILGNVDHFLENLEHTQLEKGKDASRLIPVEFQYSTDSNKVFDRVVNLIYLGATLGIMYALFKSLRSTLSSVNKGGDVFGMGKSNVKVYGQDSKVQVKFKDVAGLDEAKTEITEFVDFLKKPKKYKEIGAKLPKGALLAGPPGTGKTLLAKACAGEAGVPFFYISGSDFVEMFVGVGASRVRDLFKQAKQKSPSIIFIDEIDAVGRKRENKIGGNDERDNTLNQLLVEMDGFGTDSNVIVLAATNRKELLDPALTRPGRFDRTVEVQLPDIDGRKQIFMVHLKPLKLDPSKTMEEYAKRLSTLTPGFSGADIANLCNEAAILAARKNKKFIESIDFEMASERVLAGLEKKKIVSETERRVVAVHESGHAVVSWFLEGGHPLLKLTIIPRSKGSLGFAQYLPNENSLDTKEELIDRLCSILGGRCAEQEFFGRITTGAYDDLKKAYEMAYAMVSKYGMSDKIGYVGYVEGDYNKSYSDATNKLIDDEIKALIDMATQKTITLIKSHKSYIESLSNLLLEKETLDLRAIKGVLGERPFAAKSNFKAYLETSEEQEQESQTKEEEKQNDNDDNNKNGGQAVAQAL